MTSALTAVSLFAGVEGIGLALTRAGVDVVAAVEIDPAARGVIADHYPHLALFDDVTKVTGDQLVAAGFVPGRGIIAAGFPCQDLSVAGRRGGLGEGTRSGLYWHVDRLLAELAPAWCLLENVDGLLSACCPCPGDRLCIDNGRAERCGQYVKKAWQSEVPHTVVGGVCAKGCIPTHGGAMGSILGSVAHRGYGFAYRVLDAQHFGVPQRRERVFIIGHLGDPAGPVQVLLEPEGGAGDPAPCIPAGTGVAATLTGGSHRTGVPAPGRRGEDDVNLIPVRALTTRAGSTFDDQQTGQLVVSTLQGGAVGDTGSTPKRPQAAISSRSVVMALTSSGVGTCGPDDNQAQAGHLMFVKAQKAHDPEDVERWEPSDRINTLDASGHTARTATAVLGAIAHALTSEGADASEDGTGRGTPIIATPLDLRNALRADGATGAGTPSTGVGEAGDPAGTVSTGALAGVATAGEVRRLTPLECERLQGFPDNWTATSNGRPQADSARYRQMGNAVAVPVVEWIARRLVAIDAGGAA